jgi:hypothetical protein
MHLINGNSLAISSCIAAVRNTKFLCGASIGSACVYIFIRQLINIFKKNTYKYIRIYTYICIDTYNSRLLYGASIKSSFYVYIQINITVHI